MELLNGCSTTQVYQSWRKLHTIVVRYIHMYRLSSLKYSRPNRTSFSSPSFLPHAQAIERDGGQARLCMLAYLEDGQLSLGSSQSFCWRPLLYLMNSWVKNLILQSGGEARMTMFSLIVYFNSTSDKNIKIYNIIYIREVGFVSKPIVINNELCK
jgi:hypothetical protein